MTEMTQAYKPKTLSKRLRMSSKVFLPKAYRFRVESRTLRNGKTGK